MFAYLSILHLISSLSLSLPLSLSGFMPGNLSWQDSSSAGRTKVHPLWSKHCWKLTVFDQGEGSKKYLRHQKNIPVGIKNKYLRHQKKQPLESIVFYGPGHSLETKPSISVVFASFWKCSLSPVRFLQDIGPRNRAFARLDAAVSTAPATLWSSNFRFSMVALKLTLV